MQTSFVMEGALFEQGWTQMLNELERVRAASSRARYGREAFGIGNYSFRSLPLRRSEDDEDKKRRGGGGGLARQPGARGRFSHKSYALSALSSARNLPARVARKVDLSNGAQPAVVKIISAASGARRVRALFEYLGTREKEDGKRSNISIFTEAGEEIYDQETRRKLLMQWESQFTGNTAPDDLVRFSFHISGVPLLAGEANTILSDVFGGRDLAYALTNDAKGIKLSVIVTVSSKGKKLRLTGKDQTFLCEKLDSLLQRQGRSLRDFAVNGKYSGETGIRHQLKRFAEEAYGAAYKADGSKLEANDVNQLTRSWAANISSYRPRDVVHALFSAKEGTDREAFFEAVKLVMDREFAGHRWVAAPHHDTGHVHIHVAISNRSADGTRLKTSKRDLQRYREAIAQASRENGIDMIATRRTEIGSSRPFTAAHAQLTEKGVASETVKRRVRARREKWFVVEQHPQRLKLATDAAYDWQQAQAYLSKTGNLNCSQYAGTMIQKFREHGVQLDENQSKPATFPSKISELLEQIMAIETEEQLEQTVVQINSSFETLANTAAAEEAEKISLLKQQVLSLSAAQFELLSSEREMNRASSIASQTDVTDTGSQTDAENRLRADESLKEAAERRLAAIQKVGAATGLQSRAELTDEEMLARKQFGIATSEQLRKADEIRRRSPTFTPEGEVKEISPQAFVDEVRKSNPALADRLTWTVNEAKTESKFSVGGVEAFTDNGEKISVTKRHTPQITEAAVRYAAARFDGNVDVEGTPEFRQEVVEVAVAIGLDVKFKDQELSKLYSELKERAGQSNSIKGFEPEKNVEAVDKALPETSMTKRADLNEAKEPRTILINHGSAPYLHERDAEESYYVVLKDPKGERTYWGVDLERAISESGAERGDSIKLERKGKEPVVVEEKIKDADGKTVGTKSIEALRTRWEATVDKRQPETSAEPDNSNKTEVQIQRAPEKTMERGSRTNSNAASKATAEKDFER